MNRKVEWIFWDVGNVLFNDDPQAFVACRRYHEAIAERLEGYSFADFLREREEWARQGATWILAKIAGQHLAIEEIRGIFSELRSWLIERYDEHHLPFEGIEAILDHLRRDYRLAVVANQPPECRNSLVRRNLAPYFDVIAISEEIDLAKPDPRIFEWALREASIDPARAIMIGDRRDNDIAPAKALGMRTVWLKWPTASGKNWQPTDPLAREFLASCDRIPLFHALPEPANEPDETVECLEDIVEAVERIESEPIAPNP